MAKDVPNTWIDRFFFHLYVSTEKNKTKNYI